jgi:hypothetical protein
LKYIFVPRSQCAEAQADFAKIIGKQVKGTIQVHAVIPLGGDGIAVRDTSCFCDACFVNGKMVPACDGWTILSMRSDSGSGTSTNSIPDAPVPSTNGIPYEPAPSTNNIPDDQHLLLTTFQTTSTFY